MKALNVLRLLKCSSLNGRPFQGPMTLCEKKYFLTSTLQLLQFCSTAWCRRSDWKW